MNEKISDQFNKYSPEQIDKLNKMINSLVSEYKAKGVEINLEMDKEHVVYTKKKWRQGNVP